MLRAIDFRSADRDYWVDEAAAFDRFVAVWAGLDDAAWRLPGAAPSDAGGPEWSLLDHVAHVVDWYELATTYIAAARAGAAWPSDDDYEGGDFDRFNESRRDRFAAMAPGSLRTRAKSAHDAVLAEARRLPLETIRGDAAWGWVHQVLHGHALDHLGVLEPWADGLRARQEQNDPFGQHPQPQPTNLALARERFWAEDEAMIALLDETIGGIPDDRWGEPAAGGWSLADHIGHLADWFDEGAATIHRHDASGAWDDLPAEGVDAWNRRHVLAARGATPSDVRARFAAGLERLRAAIRGMTDADWLDPEGFSWAYEDLHGHVRTHVAMVGPWAARVDWPAGGR
jgi:hypothetical protein